LYRYNTEMNDGGGGRAAGEEEENDDEVEEIKKRMRLVSAQLSQMTRKQNVIASVLEHSKATAEERSVHVTVGGCTS
jgi:transcriptional regulator CtsR